MNNSIKSEQFKQFNQKAEIVRLDFFKKKQDSAIRYLSETQIRFEDTGKLKVKECRL